MKFKSVTFDLDGTLLDTVADLAEASNRTMLEMGQSTYSEDEIRSLIGRGINVLVERCLTRDAAPEAAVLATAIEAFKRHYAAVNGEKAAFYPGVLEPRNLS